MLLRPSQFTKQNGELLFLKLKTVFEQQMRKVHLHYKSKRFISNLTTIIRALQLSMNENTKPINDTECIKLYVHFYKLLFLGSPFAEKMLNIKLEEVKTKKKGSDKYEKGFNPNKIEQDWDSEELKGESGSFIIDTSEVSSSDGGGLGNEKKGKTSPSSNDSITSIDPYQKIKNHAVLALQSLFKTNGKALFNYWQLLVPSHFIKP